MMQCSYALDCTQDNILSIIPFKYTHTAVHMPYSLSVDHIQFI